MDMGAYLLTGLSGTKNSYDGDLRFLLQLRRLDIVAKERIKTRRYRLIIIDVIQPDTKEIHFESKNQSGARE